MYKLFYACKNYIIYPLSFFTVQCNISETVILESKTVNSMFTRLCICFENKH